jgi:subtilase family serine protease
MKVGMNPILSAAAMFALALGSMFMSQGKELRWLPLEQEVPKRVLDLTPVGPKALTDVIHLSISLVLKDPEGLKRFADSVSDPANPNYRHFATPEELADQFGLSLVDVKKVADYLTKQGMKVTLVGKSRQSILAEATVAQAQTAFRTTLSEFSVMEADKPQPVIRFAFTKQPSLPASVRPFIQFIGGLEDINRPRHGPVHSTIHPVGGRQPQ